MIAIQNDNQARGNEMKRTQQELELCKENVARNICHVAIGEPLDMSLKVLNQSCKFRKVWDKFAGKDREVKAKQKAYHKAYYQKPEVKAKQKAYYQKPEVKAYHKAYHQKPEVKAYHKAYYQKPEVKAKVKAYNKAYCQKPEVKAKRNAYCQKPEVKAYHKAYNQNNKNEILNKLHIKRALNKQEETK